MGNVSEVENGCLDLGQGTTVDKCEELGDPTRLRRLREGPENHDHDLWKEIGGKQLGNFNKKPGSAKPWFVQSSRTP